MPAAQLMRVDEGVFELEVGKTMDLTDRKILLSTEIDRRGKLRVFLNGDSGLRGSKGVGARINLKEHRKTQGYLEDKRDCFLDVVDIAAPRGAKATITFRLHCI